MISTKYLNIGIITFKYKFLIYAADLQILEKGKVIAMDKKLVSVIIPAYNCTKYIVDAIESALKQDVPMEIIVINDFSQDDLDSCMKKYSSDDRIRYIKNETNLGVSATRNRGIFEAKGEYIAFLDADDIWEKNKLKKQLELMNSKNVVICSTARELMYQDGTLSGYIIPTQTDFTFKDIKTHNLLNCSSVVIKTSVAREFPMHHDDCHEDYLMWLEVLQKYNDGCAVNEPLLKYRVSINGKSGNKFKCAKMTYRTYKYAGFGFWESKICFFSYILHGIKKYFWWFLKRR